MAPSAEPVSTPPKTPTTLSNNGIAQGSNGNDVLASNSSPSTLAPVTSAGTTLEDGITVQDADTHVNIDLDPGFCTRGKDLDC